MELVIPRYHTHLNSVYQIHTTPDGHIRSMPFDILDRQIRSDLTSYVTVYLNDPIIADMPFYKGLQQLLQHETAIELYYDYLDLRHPTYSYH